MTGDFSFDIAFGEASRQAHSQASRSSEQLAVAYSIVGVGSDWQVEERAQKGRAGALEHQPARIVVQIVKPCGQLIVGTENEVVVALGEKRAVGRGLQRHSRRLLRRKQAVFSLALLGREQALCSLAVSLRPGFFRRQRLCRGHLRCHCRCHLCSRLCLLLQGLDGFAAAGLKARDDLSQVHGQWGLHEEDAMHVVGHHLYAHHLYLRVIAVNGHPLVLHRLAELRQLDARLAPAARRSKGVASEVAEDGPAALYLYGNHIHAPFGIVVMVVTPVHRDFLLAGKFLFLGYLFVG